MAFKLSIQGLLLCAAMACYALAAGWLAARRRRTGMRLYGLGFAFALAAFAWRWWSVRHLPLQNLFEVFLALGMLLFPLSLFCRRFLGVSGEAADALIGLVLLWPAGFVFSDEPQKLPPALQSLLFAPHVAAYMAAYAVMAKAAVQAAAQLVLGDGAPEAGAPTREAATYRVVALGFPLLTAGLLLGAWWGKMAWGDYWNWDPKELWSLATWLTYLAYLHFRAMYGRRHAKVNAALALAGMGCVIITLLWVNLSRIFMGLHNYAS